MSNQIESRAKTFHPKLGVMVPEWWAQDLWKSKWWKFSCQKSTNEESPLPLAHYSFPTVILCCLWPLVWPLVWPSLCSVSSICLGCMRELYAPRSPLLVRMVPNFSNSTGDHGLCWPLKACSFHFFSYDLACMRLILSWFEYFARRYFYCGCTRVAVRGCV